MTFINLNVIRPVNEEATQSNMMMACGFLFYILPYFTVLQHYTKGIPDLEQDCQCTIVPN